METIDLGRTGINVTRLCLGSWQVSGWASSSDDGFKKTLEYAIERGVNFIDTAEAYGHGHSEELIGQVIKGKRDKLVLATKFWFTDSSPKSMRKALDRSLKRLGTDYIDLYQQHWPPVAPPLEESVDELIKLKKEGKIRAVGVSNWMEPEWSEISDPSKVECLQPCYSLLWRGIEKEVLPLCRKHNIAVIAYSPLCQGLLTGRFKIDTEIPKDWRKQNRLFSPEILPKALRVVDVLMEIAVRYGKSVSGVALRWLLDQPGVTAVIAGASKPEQVNDNLDALDWTLQKEDHERLSVISQDLLGKIGPHESLWGFHPRK